MIPPISESSWSAQLAVAARRELGAARRVSSGGALTRDSTGGRRERHCATYTIDSASTVTDRGDEVHATVSGPLTKDGARALNARLPLDNREPGRRPYQHRPGHRTAAELRPHRAMKAHTLAGQVLTWGRKPWLATTFAQRFLPA
ncbi:hypothetical protein [Nocardia sp. NBC_01388]|uniref:hypothetical protein n=1 Tax=Nocardia sp. NBC_01388 TaxID=2903596 RepID=UPI00325268E7